MTWIFRYSPIRFGTALDLANQVVEDAQVLRIQGITAHAAEMVVERPHGSRPIVQRIADCGECHPRIEAGRPFESAVIAGHGAYGELLVACCLW